MPIFKKFHNFLSNRRSRAQQRHSMASADQANIDFMYLDIPSKEELFELKNNIFAQNGNIRALYYSSQIEPLVPNAELSNYTSLIRKEIKKIQDVELNIQTLFRFGFSILYNTIHPDDMVTVNRLVSESMQLPEDLQIQSSRIPPQQIREKIQTIDINRSSYCNTRFLEETRNAYISMLAKVSDRIEMNADPHIKSKEKVVNSITFLQILFNQFKRFLVGYGYSILELNPNFANLEFEYTKLKSEIFAISQRLDLLTSVIYDIIDKIYDEMTMNSQTYVTF